MSEQKTKIEEKEAKKPAKSKSLIAIIRIKGLIRIGGEREATLKMLHLHRKNYCSVVESTPSMLGMVKKVDSAVTWGEIDEKTYKEMKEKRGEKGIVRGKEALKPFFRLNSPRGGFERKGIKAPFKVGGVLGYRADKINDLIRRML